MNRDKCCRICLEDSYYVGYSFQEYVGDSTIGELVRRICPEIIVSEFSN